MSYQVIARKFRPTRFADVVGQEVVTRTLTNALTLGRVAHAYLLSGTRGVGKTTTARLLAKCLNCHAGVSADPCGSCPSCQEIGTAATMDVLEIDGASNRGINEVRELRESARYAPARDRHKVFIIDEVHMLTAEAFNALLKTLEEPPSHVVFIMATTERDKVPATILSRCQKLDFRRLGTDEIEASLARTGEALGVTIEPAALMALATAADGSVRDAQSLLEQVMAYAGDTVRASDVDVVLGAVPRRLTLRILEAIAAEDPAAVLGVVDELYRAGMDPRLFATTLLSEMRNVILLAAGGESARTAGKALGPSLPDETAALLRPLVEGRELSDLLRSAEVLARLDRDLRQASLPRFALELGLLEIVEMRRLLPIEEIIARLDAPTAATLQPRQTPPSGAPGRPARPPAAPAPPVTPRPRSEPSRTEGAREETPFLAAAREALGLRAGFLDDVAAHDVQGNELVLTLRAGSAAASILSAPDVIAILQDAASRHVQPGLRVRLASDGGTAPAARTASSAETDRVKEAPLVRKLLDIFQGDVAAVDRPDAPRPGGQA